MSVKKQVAFWIGTFCLFFNTFAQITIGSLSLDATTMIGIFIGAIILWLFVDVGWPSLLILVSLLQLNIVNTSTLMADSLGNNTIAFLIFSCMLTYGLSATGLLRRVAVWFISTPIAKKSSWAFAAMYFISILLIGSFIAPTVLFVLYFALAKEIYEINHFEQGNPFARMLMIGTAIMTSISCAMTPIAHTFPLMAIGFYEAETGNVINWIDYMSIGIPIGILTALIAFGILYFGFKKHIVGNYIQTATNTSKITKKEIISGIVFLFVILLWLVPGIFPEVAPTLKSWTTTIPPIIGVIILSFCGIIKFNEAIKEGVPWTAIILCATTLTVGKYLTSQELGITTAVGDLLINEIHMPSAFVLIAIITIFTLVMTNLMSNIVTTTVAYNLLTPIVIATGVISPALSTILIGIGASMAYATPPSIAHVALASGSGWCDSKDMLKYGGLITIVSIVLIIGFGLLFKGVI